MIATRCSSRAALATALLAIAVLCGCSMPHLAGTNDAELEYAPTIDGVPPAALALGIKARLSSAQIAADVETGEDLVRVVVDSDVAGGADDLILWRGGMAVYLVDDSDGGRARQLEGTADDVQRALREAKPEPGRAYFAQRMPGDLFRACAVSTPELATLGLSTAPITSIRAVQHGRALAFTLGAAAQSALEQVRASHPSGRIALVRGHTLLGVLPMDEAVASPLVLPFGADLAAFTRAYRARELLGSPILPPLKRLAAARTRPRWGIAAACLLLPFALSLAWLSFVRRFDRARPEPTWLVVATFALGGLAILPAGLAEIQLAKVSEWLDPSLVTLGGQAWALPLAVPIFTLTVGYVEEGAKLAAAWILARHRREFDEPVDGIVYGCAAALGFAAVENVKYFALGRMAGTVIALRAFVTVPAHMFFGAIWGYALGKKLVSRRTSVLGFLSLSALAHGLFDALLSTDGMVFFAGLLVVALSVVFVDLLRRALRHGAVAAAPEPSAGAPPATEPMPVSGLARVFFRVGSGPAFLGYAAGMVTCAFALTVLGTVYEVLHHRVGFAFVAIATAILAVFGALANGAASTIPLDVAVDAHGVTYSGARTPWPAIALVDVEAVGRRALVRLHTMAGIVRLGPTSPENASAIAAAVRAGKA